MNEDTALSKLAEPFPPEDVEWRVGRAGKKDGKVWAKVLAYITNRAIMERLDEVCGPENWKNEYREGPGGGVLCGISIRVGDEWVTKWDGAENTEIESVKGGLSGSMKRAAVQWGIGRFLYNLDEGWADVHPNGEHYGRLPKDKGGDPFHWDPPQLPGWALPEGNGKPTRAKNASEPDPEPEPEPDAADKALREAKKDCWEALRKLIADDAEMKPVLQAYGELQDEWAPWGEWMPTHFDQATLDFGERGTELLEEIYEHLDEESQTEMEVAGG